MWLAVVETLWACFSWPSSSACLASAWLRSVCSAGVSLWCLASRASRASWPSTVLSALLRLETTVSAAAWVFADSVRNAARRASSLVERAWDWSWTSLRCAVSRVFALSGAPPTGAGADAACTAGAAGCAGATAASVVVQPAFSFGDVEAAAGTG